VSIAQLPSPGRPADHLDDLDDLMGVVLNLDATAKTFSLHTADGDFPIQASTIFLLRKTEEEIEAHGELNELNLLHDFASELLKRRWLRK
jgi:hypothetical protein